jgi:hypothetical protein
MAYIMLKYFNKIHGKRLFWMIIFQFYKQKMDYFSLFLFQLITKKA